MQAKLLQHHKSSPKISPIYSFWKFSAVLKLKLKILLNEKSLKASNLINDIPKFIRQIQKLGFRTEANDCIQCVVKGSRLAYPNSNFRIKLNDTIYDKFVSKIRSNLGRFFPKPKPPTSSFRIQFSNIEKEKSSASLLDITLPFEIYRTMISFPTR